MAGSWTIVHSPRTPIRGQYAPIRGGQPAAVQVREPTMPTFLGFASATFIMSTCLASTASESVAWIPQVVAAGVGALWICVGVILQGQRIRWISPISLYMLFCAWACTGILVTIDQEYFLGTLKTYWKVALITWVLSQTIRTRKDILACCLAITVSSIVVAILGRDQITRALNAGNVIGDAAKARANDTLLGNANYLGMFAALVILCGLTCFLAYRSLILKGLAIIGALSGLYLVAASGSRTSMLGLACGVVATFVFHFRKLGLSSITAKMAAVIFGFGLLIGTGVFITKLPFFYRMVDVLSSKEELMKEPRVRYFFTALEVISENPVFGLGLGGFALHRLGKTKLGYGHYSHTSVAETLSTTGLPGFTFYFWSLFALFQFVRRVRKMDLPKEERLVSNMVISMLAMIISFNAVAIVDTHRLIWPLCGGFAAYLWNMQQKYGMTSISPQLGRVTVPRVRRLPGSPAH